jgi:hypothetical protein
MRKNVSLGVTLILSILIYTSCKKTDVVPFEGAKTNSLEEKFFNTNRTDNSTEVY